MKQLLNDEKMRYAEEQSIKNASIMNTRMQIKTQRMTARAAVEGFKWNRSKDVQDEFRLRALQEK